MLLLILTFAVYWMLARQMPPELQELPVINVLLAFTQESCNFNYLIVVYH